MNPSRVITRSRFSQPEVSDKSVRELFEETAYGLDFWDACSDLGEVLVYCRGSKLLHIPNDEWRALLPKEL